MHRRFRELLNDAHGESDFVVALNIDIRSFSSWSRKVESAQAILYLKKVYPKLIDRYFAEDWFFKPTGDGLLLVRSFEEEELPGLVNQVLASTVEIVSVFGSLCDDEPMVNFDVPQNVGIGVAQGAASRLVSGDFTLDYSGRVLNLASRLMELARPRGVIVDAGFGAGLRPETWESVAVEKTGYIRGVSPDEPITISYLPEFTEISDEFEKKPGEFEWQTTERSFTLKAIEDMGEMNWKFELECAPIDPKLVKLTASHDMVSTRGQKLVGHQTIHTITKDLYTVRESAGEWSASLNLPMLAELLRKAGVKGPWPVSLKVDYPT